MISEGSVHVKGAALTPDDCCMRKEVEVCDGGLRNSLVDDHPRRQVSYLFASPTEQILR